MNTNLSPWRRLLLRAAATIVALAATGLLAACVTDDDDDNLPPANTPGGVQLQIVSFGDSLSDVGTYAPFASTLGGGRFTTNPGQVWTQLVATYYGDTLIAAQTGGYSVPVVNNPNGYGYGQGGALVTNPQGNGWAPNGTAALTVPVATQLQNYLSGHGNFRNNQLARIRFNAATGLYDFDNVDFNAIIDEFPCPAGRTLEWESVAVGEFDINVIRQDFVDPGFGFPNGLSVAFK